MRPEPTSTPRKGSSDAMAGPELSIVTTVYESRPYLERFLRRCRSVAEELGILSYEIVCVVDGSPDDSLTFLREQLDVYPQLTIIELSRNFGHHNAAWTGLKAARGDLVFLIDCDLEVDPGVLIEFHRELSDGHWDVVYGYQTRRKGRWIERLGGAIFWWLFNLLSDAKVTPNVVTERLLTRAYVQALLEVGDRNLFLAGLMEWVGFRQIGLPVVKRQRAGPQSYGLAKRTRLLVEAVTSFSPRPLYWLFWVGTLLMTASFAYGLALVFRRLIDPESVLSGFTSLATLIAFSAGLTVAGLGLVGIYLAKVYFQTKQRPIAIVRDIYRKEAK